MDNTWTKDVMIRQSDIIVPENWSYEKSIKKVKPLVYKWKNITIAILTELAIAILSWLPFEHEEIIDTK